MASTDPTGEVVGLMPPPPGVVPDFYHTTPVQVSFIAVFAVSFALATIALLLRVYTRVLVVKSVGLDERMLPMRLNAYLFYVSRSNMLAALLISAWAVTLAFFVESLKGVPLHGIDRSIPA